ncbi:hypothetical protein KVR01_009060 [Diaporthe batatas]|uniref:uncharacterized protein n=1 Tax=Diaporthe batatas TaxID=748121 RepID=UPI001D03FFA4|nr:uncharacterized protein KVR01_009060 [Diaporthe batatas]KAG8160796.1 hypothetical protein KVR01_009060 [Diaporthe batatas]
MAPKLSEDDIDDIIYFARAGELTDLEETLSALSAREGVSPAEIILAARDEGKSTCLHMATGNGNIEIVKSILAHFTARPSQEKQLLLDAQNAFGNTALHWAAERGHLDLVRLLVAEGASPGVANDKNYVPLDSASFGERHGVVDFFLAQMEGMETRNGAEGGGLGSAAEGVRVDAKGEEDGEGEEEEEEFVMRAGDTTEDGKGGGSS